MGRTCRFLLAFLSVVFISACQSAREAYLRAHPDLPGWVKESYLKGKPAPGMNEEMIRTLLNVPARIETDTATGDAIWKWGRVQNWSDTGGRDYRGFVANRIVRFRRGLAVEVKP